MQRVAKISKTIHFENVRDYFSLFANLLAAVLVKIWQRRSEIRRTVWFSRTHISSKIIFGCSWKVHKRISFCRLFLLAVQAKPLNTLLDHEQFHLRHLIPWGRGESNIIGHTKRCTRRHFLFARNDKWGLVTSFEIDIEFVRICTASSFSPFF